MKLLGVITKGQRFNDGNKRTAQLGANHVLVHNGTGVLAVPVEQRKEFLTKLAAFYETGEQQALNDFLYEEVAAKWFDHGEA